MNYFEKFERNLQGRDFMITDNHGCWSEVQDLLSITGFDGRVDRLFHGGDLVDRGPESTECLAWISQDWFHPIVGNHEWMAILVATGHTLQNYERNGGEWFLRLPQELRLRFAEVFLTLPYAMEIDLPWGRVGVVHAEPLESATSTAWDVTVGVLSDFDNYSKTIQHAVREVLFWKRDRKIFNMTDPVNGIDRVYVGHTPHLSAVQLGNMHYIDTGLVYGDKLTCVNLTEDTVIEIPAKRRYWVKQKR